jgi:hypothetical protein
MYHKTLPWAAASLALSLTIGCSSNGPASPAAPSTVNTAGDTGAASDGSTLKASAPTPVSPANDVRLENRQPTMTVNNASGKFAGGNFTYEFQLQTDGGGTVATTILPAGAGTTTWAFQTDLERDTPYRWRARARMDAAFGPWSTSARFFTVKENRTPNAPGGRLPLPEAIGRAVIAQVVAQNPGILSKKRSCQEPAFGGDHVTGWEFMDKVVDALRLTDTRWGYNGKRGNPNDPSLDVAAYNWGNQPDEGTTNVYIIDLVGGHCGDNATAGWNDVTQITLNAGTIGRWISRGRFAGSQGIQ